MYRYEWCWGTVSIYVNPFAQLLQLYIVDTAVVKIMVYQVPDTFGFQPFGTHSFGHTPNAHKSNVVPPTHVCRTQSHQHTPPRSHSQRAQASTASHRCFECGPTNTFRHVHTLTKRSEPPSSANTVLPTVPHSNSQRPQASVATAAMILLLCCRTAVYQV